MLKLYLNAPHQAPDSTRNIRIETIKIENGNAKETRWWNEVKMIYLLRIFCFKKKKKNFASFKRNRIKIAYAQNIIFSFMIWICFSWFLKEEEKYKRNNNESVLDRSRMWSHFYFEYIDIYTIRYNTIRFYAAT